ncbi:cupin domain-containing protein [Castellaniella sp.]|uniref:cupin domain-containing protein n=1 Tax=Castellaniella sp. TaxID=1955812 RepID=UPI003C70E578
MPTHRTSFRALIAALDLQPHPEGGHYREVFRSGLQVPFLGAQRSAGTSIYYLLAQGAYSAWHRIDADEIWCFHAGGLLDLHVVLPDGGLRTHRLGDPLTQPGAVYQAAVPAGCWFAAKLADPDDFVLAGCVVAPGFEFSGFQLAGEADLADVIGRHGDWVRRLLAGPADAQVSDG